jgi:hypothetical protein
MRNVAVPFAVGLVICLSRAQGRELAESPERIEARVVIAVLALSPVEPWKILVAEDPHSQAVFSERVARAAASKRSTAAIPPPCSELRRER